MAQIKFPYGKEKMEYTFDDKELKAVLTSAIEEYEPGKTPDELVREAMRNPVGGVTLGELAKGKKNIVIIASDHTRPVPSKVIIPPMLEEIRSASPDANITILIATGMHRPTTEAELRGKLGSDILVSGFLHFTVTGCNRCADKQHA